MQDTSPAPRDGWHDLGDVFGSVGNAQAETSHEAFLAEWYKRLELVDAKALETLIAHRRCHASASGRRLPGLLSAIRVPDQTQIFRK
jgi:hypothetical protein